MNILILNDYFSSIAGGFVAAYNLAAEFRKQGHTIAFITTVQQKHEQGLTWHEGMPVYRIYTRYPLRFRGVFGIWNPFVFREFRRIVQEVQPDIIHAHIIHMYLSHYVLKIAHDLGIPTVLTAHDVMTFCYTKLWCSLDGSARHKARFSECLRCQRFRYVPFRNACLRYYINTYAAKVITVSRALQTGLEINGIANVQTIYNGIDPDRYMSSQAEVQVFKQQHQLHGKKVILHAGRLSKFKGSENLIRALPRILASHQNTRVLVLGHRDTYTDYLYQLAKTLGVHHALVFSGWLKGDELIRAYAACDVCVMPSIRFEALGMVALEAMTLKKPVIGTSVGGIPEVIEDGKSGYLIPPENISEVADKVGRLFENEAMAKEFGKQGYQRILEVFHIQHQYRQTLELYLQVIN